MALHSFCDSDPTGGEDPTMAPYVQTAVLSTIQGSKQLISNMYKVAAIIFNVG